MMWKISCYSDIMCVEKKLGSIAKREGASGAIVLLMFCTCKILFTRKLLCFIGKGDRLLQSIIYTQSHRFENILVHHF